MLNAVIRAVRVALAYAGGTFISNLLQQPTIVALGISAVLSGICKYLRAKYKNLWWLPV